jgi:hypothetical protein
MAAAAGLWILGFWANVARTWLPRETRPRLTAAAAAPCLAGRLALALLLHAAETLLSRASLLSVGIKRRGKDDWIRPSIERIRIV